MKSWKLWWIARALQKEVQSRTFAKYLKFETRRSAKEDLFDLVENDPDLGKLLKKYNADRTTLEDLYSKLCLNGAGQILNGHFVAASSLAFIGTLDYLLRNHSRQPGSFQAIAYRLIQYFEKNETGLID